jgi:hypothetical protein
MKHDPEEIPGDERSPNEVKIEAALEDLGECWMYNRDFMSHYGITQSAIGRYRAKYSANNLMYGRSIIWSGSPATISKIKERVHGC